MKQSTISHATHRARSFTPASDTPPPITLGDIDKKLTALIQSLSDARTNKKALRLTEVKSLTGDSRSQIYARMNSRYPAYDETWPLPFYVGNSPRWWEHDVIAWLEAQANLSSKHH